MGWSLVVRLQEDFPAWVTHAAILTSDRHLPDHFERDGVQVTVEMFSAAVEFPSSARGSHKLTVCLLEVGNVQKCNRIVRAKDQLVCCPDLWNGNVARVAVLGDDDWFLWQAEPIQNP